MIKKPSFCFKLIGKNEGHCILETLNSIYKYIDYWVICDTGSTDNTRELIIDFFEEKNIQGEMYIDDWVGFAHNKSLMFERCYKKTDFIIHFDADDLFIGDFVFEENDWLEKISYSINIKRGSCKYTYTALFNNNYKWITLCNIHTTFKCINNVNLLKEGDLRGQPYYILSRDIGNRKNDPQKYIRDSEILKNEFLSKIVNDEYNISSRIIFYTAQSYYDSYNYVEALKWYTFYTKLKDFWKEELFECYIRIMKCFIKLNYDTMNIIKSFNNAIKIFNDRAEPYFELGIYFNSINNYELGYFNFKKAKLKNIEDLQMKYILFVDINTYGININYDLAVSCYYLKKYEEGIKLVDEIKLEKNYVINIENIDNLLILLQRKINKITS